MQQTLFDLSSSAVASPAKTFRWLDDVLDLLGNGAGCGTNSTVSSTNLLPSGFVSKTSLAFCHLTADGISESSFAGWQNSGMGGLTECSTHSGSEWPNAAAVCSLSDVLETCDVPQKYFLSAKACRGILRRAEKRGRELPGALAAALTQAATTDKTT